MIGIHRMTFSAAAVLLLLAASIGTSGADEGGIAFEDAAAAAGILSVGPSWGAAWGFFNGDAHPDLWLVNHWNKPGLYVNQGDGTFLDVVTQVVQNEYLWSDCHGASWIDFDNDGDQDLYHLTDFDPDSYLPLQDFFFINAGGRLTEKTDSLGLYYPLGRGRTPLWLDYDGDGLLDVYRPTSHREGMSDGPTVLFRHGPYCFVDASTEVGLAESSGVSEFALLADLAGTGIPQLVTHHDQVFPASVYDVTTTPFTDLRAALGIPSIEWVNDAVAADFDNDLDVDLFLVRGEKEEGFVQIDPCTVEAAFLAAHPVEIGLVLETDGDLTVDLYPRWKYPLAKIHIGEEGLHPEDYTFTLCSADTGACGLYPHTPGAEVGMYIGYDSLSRGWRILHARMAINLVLTSTETITGVAAVGWDPEEPPLSDCFLVNLGDSFEDRTAAAGFTVPSSGRNVVSGDFDNDMDLDLYIVSTGPVENAPNILYRNDGGVFYAVPNAGGAAGDDRGRGEAVSVCDYDGDGFLDLLVTNGKSKAPFDEDGPVFLFRNLGNENHWIEIDLEGLATNRDGIGARLVLKAGGTAQLREQNGGMHVRGQNHQRVHFGLGPNTMVDTLTITWPSGVVQDTCGIAADQIIRIVEDFHSAVGGGGDVAPAAVRLSPCRPNPFNPRTTIAFTLPRSGAVDLALHDTAGRLVRRLAAGDPFPAGENEVVWDGRDDSGRPAASGVYLVRLRADGERRAGKVVLLR